VSSSARPHYCDAETQLEQRVAELERTVKKLSTTISVINSTIETVRKTTNTMVDVVYGLINRVDKL